jgi:hypothetical protein
MNHTEPAVSCVGCIRGRLAVLTEHERHFAGPSMAEFYGVGRCPERRGEARCDLPEGHHAQHPHQSVDPPMSWFGKQSCFWCGAPGQYHATHCRMATGSDAAGDAGTWHWPAGAR